VVVADLHGDRTTAVARELRDAGAPDALGVACDVAKEDDVGRCVAETTKRFGRLDVVVNNAGVMVFRKLVEHTAAAWWKGLHVDPLGAFFSTRAACRAMRPGGAIVNVSSVHAIETTPLVASYAAAKTALLSLTRSASLEGKPLGIRVNAVLPGAIDTPML